MNKKIIVSTTTTNNRLKFLFYMLESLKKQSVQPDIIYVNISKEKYLIDEGIKIVPDWLKQNENVTVNFVDNIGSYRKLIPLFEKNLVTEDDLIITVDDDVLYGEHWLENLIAKSNEHPDSIICARGREIRKNFFNRDQNYMNWRYFKEETLAYNIIPTGNGGILYKLKLLDLSFLLNKTYLELAPTNDDLWFRKSYTCSVLVVPKIDEGRICLEHNLGLWSNFNTNTKANLNLHNGALALIKSLPYFFVVKIKDYLGVSATNYDIAWKSILQFCEQRQ